MRPAQRLQLGLVLLATLLALLATPSVRAAPPAPTYFLGDVNCDGAVDSIDAALLLQVEAALIADLPCAGNADMNGDGASNSADVGLVLQYTAGVIKSRVQFALNVTRPAGLCDDAEKPSVCNVPAGTEFGLSILLNHPPADGYISFATELYYGDLRYNPTTYADEEIVWPETGLAARSPGAPTGTEGLVDHGALSASARPFRISTHRGDVVRLSLSCPTQPWNYVLALIAYDPSRTPLGATVNLPDETIAETLLTGRQDLDIDVMRDGRIDPSDMNVPAAATLQINCVAP